MNGRIRPGRRERQQLRELGSIVADEVRRRRQEREDCRAGISCGEAECGRHILTAGNPHALDRAIAAWRCPRCERPAC